MAEQNVGGVEGKNRADNNNDNMQIVRFICLKPQLVVEAPKAADVVQFYKATFGADEIKHEMQTKRKADQELPLLLFAELKFGSSLVIVSKPSAPVKTVGTGYVLCLETEDFNDAAAKVVKDGDIAGKKIAEGEIDYCGERVLKVKDPFGYTWCNKRRRRLLQGFTYGQWYCLDLCDYLVRPKCALSEIATVAMKKFDD